METKKNCEVVVVNVYSLCDRRKRFQGWKELKHKRASSIIKLWCIVWDFNYVRRPFEREGVGDGMLWRREREEFNNFIEHMELVDASLVGRNFSWYRPNGLAKSRTDRVLVSLEWFDIRFGCTQYILNRNIFDRCLILLKDSTINWDSNCLGSLIVGWKKKVFKIWWRRNGVKWKLKGGGLTYSKKK